MNQKRKKPSVKLVSRTVQRVPHPVAAKLRLVRHAHSGQLVHRHHTSYGVLVILLVITGFFVFIGYDISHADTRTQSGSVTVGLNVPGSPPTAGAIITSPKDGAVSQQAIVNIEGTCARGTEVVVHSNDTLVGSVLCSSSLTFQLRVQLFAGVNKLTALGYDALNQAGPITPAVTLTYAVPTPGPSNPLPMMPIVIPSIVPTPPLSCSENPAPTACHMEYVTADTCDEYAGVKNIPVSAEVRVAIVCVPRYTYTPGSTSVGILIWGGHPPYAVSIDWGDKSTVILKSVQSPGYFVMTKKFGSVGEYITALRVSDSAGQQAYAQASIQVLGPAASNNFVEYIGRSLNMSWFDSPVPTYLLAVALVIGFWAGDYFERTVIAIPKRRRRDHKHA